MPEHSEEEIILAERKARDAQGERYDEGFGWDREALDACAARLLTVETGQTVVDAGCGTGRWLPRLTDAGAQVIAVDHSEGLLEVARGRVAVSKQALVDVRQGDVRTLPVEDGAADWVLCSEVIQHVPGEDNRREALDEFRRVLRPGGGLVLTVYRWLGHVKRKKEGYWTGTNPIYRYAFTARELGRALSSAGFTEVEVHGAVIAPYLSARLGMSVETAVRLSFSPLGHHTADFLVARARNPR